MELLIPPEAYVPCEEIEGVLYPYEESEPVVQGEWHYLNTNECINMTRALMWEKPEAGIYSDMFVFWRKGHPHLRYAPDLIVFPRVQKTRKERKSIYLWHEQSRPMLVLELISTGTANEDWTEKKRVYQDEIQIPEYLLGDSRKIPLIMSGFRLVNGDYAPIYPNEQGRIWSEQVQGWFGPGEDGMLQVWDAQGEPMPRYEDALRQRLQALREREREEQRRIRAEEERDRAEQRRIRAEAERDRMMQEAQQETLRANAAEARLRQLEEQIRRTQS